MKNTVCAFITSMIIATAQADVRLPMIFSDHMVLQRDQSVRVWGWATPGENVAVKFGGQSLSAIADKDGAWSVELVPMKASATVVLTCIL